MSLPWWDGVTCQQHDSIHSYIHYCMRQIPHGVQINRQFCTINYNLGFAHFIYCSYKYNSLKPEAMALKNFLHLVLHRSSINSILSARAKRINYWLTYHVRSFCDYRRWLPFVLQILFTLTWCWRLHTLPGKPITLVRILFSILYSSQASYLS